MAIALMLNVLSLALPIMMLQVYDRIIPHQSYGTLAALLLWVMGALVLDAALRVIRAWLVGWSAASREHNTSCAALEHIIQAELSSFSRISTGEHMQNFSALNRLREFYSGQTLTALIDLPFAVLFLGLIAYIGGWLVLVPLGLLCFFLAGASLAGNRLKNALQLRNKADDRKASFVVSALSGIHTAKSMGLEMPLIQKFERDQAHVTRESYQVALASAAAGSLSTAFGQLSLILTAAVGAILVINGTLSVGGLSACTLLAGRAIQPVQRVLSTWLRMQDLGIARAQAENIFAMPLNIKEKPSSIPSVEGTIELERIAFSHNRKNQLFENLSLDVKPGEVVALRGEKGSGKSSLLQIIAGALHVQDGRVLVDGMDPSQLNMSDLAGRIAYMPQQGVIFRGTILENLTGFRNDETTIRRAREACADLGLDAVIDQLPRGYQTVLRDTVADPVTPGIKQRIALTRALVDEPAIILFDDADRALDKDGYNMLFRLIGRLKGRCTIVMASEDENLLSFADRTYDLVNGKADEAQEMGARGISYLSRRKDGHGIL